MRSSDGPLLRTAMESRPLRRYGAHALRRQQARRLQRVIRHAARRVPYYRELFARLGIDFRAIRSADDLAQLPLLTKAIVQARHDDLLATGVDEETCIRRVTSGTSQEPVFIPTSWLEEQYQIYLWIQLYTACGIRCWHRHARFAWDQIIPRTPRLPQRLGFYRRDYYSIHAAARDKVDWLRKTDADVLVCWATTLNEIVSFLEERDMTLHVPVTISTSSTLPPNVRQRAESRLRTRVYDLYGSVEAGPVAWECPHAGGYHVRSNSVIMEILDEHDRPARKGRVVCTPLWRYAFPILRMELGDLAEWDEAPCSCGSPFPKLNMLHGRVMDLIQPSPEADKTTPMEIMGIMYRIDGIKEFQYVQEGANRFIVRYVPGSGYSDHTERAIQSFYAEQSAGDFNVRYRKVRAITRVPGYKGEMFLSLKRLEHLRHQGIDVSAWLDFDYEEATG